MDSNEVDTDALIVSWGDLGMLLSYLGLPAQVQSAEHFPIAEWFNLLKAGDYWKAFAASTVQTRFKVWLAQRMWSGTLIIL